MTLKDEATKVLLAEEVKAKGFWSTHKVTIILVVVAYLAGLLTHLL